MVDGLVDHFLLGSASITAKAITPAMKNITTKLHSVSSSPRKDLERLGLAAACGSTGVPCGKLRASGPALKSGARGGRRSRWSLADRGAARVSTLFG